MYVLIVEALRSIRNIYDTFLIIEPNGQPNGFLELLLELYSQTVFVSNLDCIHRKIINFHGATEYTFLQHSIYMQSHR